MTVNSIFIMAATVVFCMGFLIWEKKSLLNFFIKVVLFGMFIWGLILALIDLKVF